MFNTMIVVALIAGLVTSGGIRQTAAPQSPFKVIAETS
jgi:hypothetical protein